MAQETNVSKKTTYPHFRDVALEWFANKPFYGCIFINAIGEYGSRDPAISQACQSFKTQMTAFVEATNV